MLELEMETFYKCKFDMLINIKIKDLRGHFYFRKDIKNVIRNYYGAY